MLDFLRKRVDEDEQGFTLIELLVVVIIIGILAAIAIPTFLSQRQRGWQAELTSTVRNVALEVEAAATAAGGDYTGLDTEVAGFTTDIQGAGGPVTISAAAADFDSAGFVICGVHASLTTAVGNHNVTYDSGEGGVQGYVEGTGC